MELNKATIEEFESIIAFYDDVTERTPDMERFARWQKRKHPTIDGIRANAAHPDSSVVLYCRDTRQPDDDLSASMSI
jgi:hypothetical protein